MPIITPGSRSVASFPADAVLSLLDIQDLETACGYSWIVETRYHGATDSKCSRVSVAFVGSRKGRKAYAYRHALSGSQNHLAAAVEWLQQLSSLNGAPAYSLVSKVSTAQGYVFTFV